jgi:hypothetical protein
MKEEIRFILKHPFISLFVVGTITGVIPALLMGIMIKIFG